MVRYDGWSGEGGRNGTGNARHVCLDGLFEVVVYEADAVHGGDENVEKVLLKLGCACGERACECQDVIGG